MDNIISFYVLGYVGIAVLTIIILAGRDYIVRTKENTRKTYSQPSHKPTLTQHRYIVTDVKIDQKRAYVTVTLYDKLNNYYFERGVNPATIDIDNFRFTPLEYCIDEVKRRIELLPDDWKLNAKIKKFWSDCDTLVDTYARCGDIDSLTEFLKNVWDTRDRVEYAEELHYLTIKAINAAYPHREEREENIDLILFLCELDISNYDNLKKFMNISDVSLISPQKKTIILEKKHLYHEALDFSIWCKERNINETRDKSFDDRIARLTKKCGGADEKTS